MTYSDIKFHTKPTNPKFIDLEGQTFGELKVLGFAGQNQTHNSLWYCQCSCGYIKIIKGIRFVHHGQTTCGECIGQGENSKSPEYRTFIEARARCQNPNDDDYKDYGGRGIEFRFKNVPEFIEAIGRKQNPTDTIDRIDNNGHYEKGNVRWTNQKTQCRNKRTTKYLTVGEVTKPLMDFVDLYNTNEQTIRTRLKLGWCDSCAVTLPRYAVCPHK